jgi:hypothetical protein
MCNVMERGSSSIKTIQGFQYKVGGGIRIDGGRNLTFLSRFRPPSFDFLYHDVVPLWLTPLPRLAGMLKSPKSAA